MKTIFVATLLLMMTFTGGFAADGLVSVKSPYSTIQTMDRLEEIVTQKGLTVFARIDHAKGAQRIGKFLRPTELLMFGNPQGGTPFMECAQTVAIDLPLKALVWEDQQGQVWLSYNEPGYLAARHAAGTCPVVDNLSRALNGISQKAVETEAK
ncbi:MAG: DUF302 domain-containing protein [Desulfuromonadales bacterium]|nr:DUF302 domain-containing protein [Desulfuromonadales bacterium]